MSFFNSIGKSLSNAASDVSRGVSSISRDVTREVDKHWSHPLLDMFKSGNVVQLVSQTSGYCVQIVTAPTGQLVVDGLGAEGPNIYNAHWTVINEGNNSVKLHNNSNYLAIVNGATVLGNFPDPAVPGPETRFRVAISGNFILLESIKEPGRHIAILQTGALKSALAAGKDNDSHFAPKLIYSPHPTTTTTTTVTKK